MRDYKVVEKFLTEDEKDDAMVEARTLQDDIEFFMLYMKREKKSRFNFSLQFSRGLTNSFFRDLWYRYYYMFKDDLYGMLKEYYAVYHAMHDLDDSTNEYSDSDILELCNWFQNEYSMELVDYVGDFIGGSIGVTATKEKLMKIAGNN